MHRLIFAFLSFALLLCAEDGFTPLFDGKSLNGWRSPQKPGYIVENGILICPETGGGGNLYTEKQYADFVLRFEFQMKPDSNNGIGIRMPYDSHAASQGMEIQLLDDTGPLYKGKLRPEQLQGAIYDVIPARYGFLKPHGEWNEQEIVAKGRQITVKLNGAIILDANLDIVREPEVLKKHPGLARISGHVALLGHNSWMTFRNIRIKELR
jgi:hypothetical protein